MINAKTVIIVIGSLVIGFVVWYLFSGNDIPDDGNGIDNAIVELNNAQGANDSAAERINSAAERIEANRIEAARMADESGEIATGLQDAGKSVRTIRTGLNSSQGRLTDMQGLIDQNINILRAIQARTEADQK